MNKVARFQLAVNSQSFSSVGNSVTQTVGGVQIVITQEGTANTGTDGGTDPANF